MVEENPNTETVKDETVIYELTNGGKISAIKLWLLLFGKRFRVLRRRYVPHLVVVAFAIIGAGIAPLLIRNFRKPMQCPIPGNISNFIPDEQREDFGNQFVERYIFGPPDKLNETRLEQMTTVYSINNTIFAGCDPEISYCGNPRPGYQNMTALKDEMVMIDSYSHFVGYDHELARRTLS